MATTLEPLPGTDPTMLLQDFNRAFQQVSEALPKARKHFGEITGHLKFNPIMLSPAAALGVKRCVKTIGDALDKVEQLAKYAVSHQTPVVSLIVQSFNWVTDVKAPMSTMSGQAADWTVNENLRNWTGKAADTYRDKAARQGEAMASVTGKADFISKWLFAIVRSNVDFMAKLAEIATAFAGKVVEVSINATGGITLPVSVVSLAKAIGEVVTKGMDALIEIGKRFVAALGDALDIESDKADQKVLPGGAWPQAVHVSLATRLGPSVHPGF